MKRILRHFVIDTFCLWVTSQIAQGMVFQSGYKTLLITGIAVTMVSLVAKPVINLLLLPINLITFGLFRWVGASVILYLVTLLVKEFRIQSFFYSGLTNKWLELPVLNFHGILAFIAFSFILSLLTSFIYWLIK